ncbi:MAG: AbrB/MazE/SpoVT family DNA-binding domain-containing protein [Desulfamplus sp.]|nr:AbrB/MazE/SpoVT family DNA-binding domain-containing protein [Desulfamplus sp.]
MLAKVEKWGDSLALKIPEIFAVDAQIKNDSVVEVLFADGKITIKPITPPKLTLDELLAGINNNNIHHETDTGISVGNEAW